MKICLTPHHFQTKQANLKSGRYAPVFTLWNRLTKGEIKEMGMQHSVVGINSLLQTGPEGNYVIIILLFGSVPSWYRWACHDNSFYNIPVICKRRRESRRLISYHITSNYDHIICHTNELFVLSKCFTITRWLSGPPTKGESTSRVVEQYFMRLFSILSWQTSNSYKLFITNSHPGILANATNCIETVLTPGLAYDIMRLVIPSLLYGFKFDPYSLY